MESDHWTVNICKALPRPVTSSRWFRPAIRLLCACLFLFQGPAQAYLIDTGAGGSSYSGTAVSQSQWIAGQFTITGAYTISTVEGWFGVTGVGTLSATIYNDAITGTPGTELYTTQFNLDNPVAGNAWDGAYDLSWTLDPGTYWLAFEARAGDTGSGYMPDNLFSQNGAPNPLAGYAFHSNDPAPGWENQDSSLAYGMRIDAVAAPLPAALWLFGSGLLGLAGISKRKQQ
jgi:hypothetical protein